MILAVQIRCIALRSKALELWVCRPFSRALPRAYAIYLTGSDNVQIDPAVPDKIFRYKYTCFESAATDDLMPMPACTTDAAAVRSCECRHTFAPPNLTRNVPLAAQTTATRR